MARSDHEARTRSRRIRSDRSSARPVVRPLLGSRKPFMRRTARLLALVVFVTLGAVAVVAPRAGARAERRRRSPAERARLRVAARQGQRRDRRAQACGRRRARRLPPARAPGRRRVAGAAADGDRGAPRYPRRRHREDSAAADRRADRRAGRSRRQGRHPRRSVAPGAGAGGRAGAPGRRRARDGRSCAGAPPTSIAIRSRRWKVRSDGSRAVRARVLGSTGSNDRQPGRQRERRPTSGRPDGPGLAAGPPPTPQTPPSTTHQQHREGGAPLSVQLRDLLDTATLTDIRRLEAAGAGAASPQALERAAAALRARADWLDAQSRAMRARAHAK